MIKILSSNCLYICDMIMFWDIKVIFIVPWAKAIYFTLLSENIILQTTYVNYRFFSVGMLPQKDLVSYIKTHALMYEYYRQAQEIVPPAIGKALTRLFTSEAYQIVNSRYMLPFFWFTQISYKDSNLSLS